MQFKGRTLALSDLGRLSRKAKASWDYFGFDPRERYGWSALLIFDGVSVVLELRQLVAVKDKGILDSPYNSHVSFEYLRRRAFDEDQRNGVLEAVLLRLLHNFRDLLKGTEDNHSGHY